MGNIIVTLCSALCVLVYAPVLVVAFRSITTREATITSTAAISGKMLRFTGAAAVVFGLGQILSASSSFFGVYLAVTNSDLLFLFAGAFVGAVAAVGGTWLARKVQIGDAEVDIFRQPTPEDVIVIDMDNSNPNMIIVDDSNRDEFISDDDDDTPLR